MTKQSLVRAIFQRKRSALLVLSAWSTLSYGLGLGQISVDSTLGNPLEASIPVTSLNVEDAAGACIKSSMQSLDGSSLGRINSILRAEGKNGGTVWLTSTFPVREPAVRLMVKIGCDTSINKTFDLLIDPSSIAAPGLTKRERKIAKLSVLAMPIDVEAKVTRKLPAVARVHDAKASPADSLHLSMANGDMAAPDMSPKLSLTMAAPHGGDSEAQMSLWHTLQARFAAEIRGEDPYLVAPARIVTTAMAVPSGSNTATTSPAGAGRDAGGKSVPQPVKPGAYHPFDHPAVQPEAHGLMFTMYGGLIVFFGVSALMVGAVMVLRRFRGNLARKPAGSPEDPSAWNYVVESAGKSAVRREPGNRPELVTTHDALTDFLSTGSGTLADLPATTQDDSTIARALALGEENIDKGVAIAALLRSAEHWMAEHEPIEAIAVLEPYCQNEQSSPAPALYLLELYRAQRMEKEYHSLCQKTAASFAVATPDWTMDWAQESQTVANFTKVHQAIEARRGSPELLPFLYGLMLADDPRFDFLVYRELQSEIAMISEPAFELPVMPEASHASLLETTAPKFDNDAFGIGHRARVEPESLADHSLSVSNYESAPVSPYASAHEKPVQDDDATAEHASSMDLPDFLRNPVPPPNLSDLDFKPLFPLSAAAAPFDLDPIAHDDTTEPGTVELNVPPLSLVKR